MSGDPFNIGWCRIYNGPNRGGFNPTSYKLAGDILNVSGTYYPQQADVADPDAILEAENFAINWVGLTSYPERAVPMWGPASKWGLTGYWFVESTTIDAVDAVTETSGLWRFSGRFRRVRPGFSQASQEFVGAAATRSQAVHNVDAFGGVWIPSDHRWQSVYQPTPAPIPPTTPPQEIGTASGVLMRSDVLNAAAVGTDQINGWGYATEPDAFLNGACKVEYQGLPVEGRQLPEFTDPADVRISNDTFRLEYRSNGDIYLEAYNTTSGLFREVGVMSLRRGVSVGIWEPQPPTIEVNTPEMVSIRYPIYAPADYSFSFVSFSLLRGVQYVAGSMDAIGIHSYAVQVAGTATQAATVTVGGIRQTETGPGGNHWEIVSPYESVAGQNLPAPNPSILVSPEPSAADGAQSHFGFTRWPGNATTVRYYWKILSARQRPAAT